ncbi:FAD-binding oxidoreductase [Limnochorda pilosa]|uniref:FAD-binding PCMH-type domain-containing protein n=1 Tax=Limnochorda pilosa TaxID=1555112 RepID=A0A0K2SGQ5_LIMPI|nr:FAD-binding oxidoreductase [Limnochorda pilosa]BAS26207.1 hypothetical protein LIP_0350 [Limnochorda pilosa]
MTRPVTTPPGNSNADALERWVARLPASWQPDPHAWAREQGWPRTPAWVVRPPGTEGLREILKVGTEVAAAGPAGSPGRLAVAGSGSRLAWWPLPPGVGVLDTSALGGEPELDPGNLTLSLPAFTSWPQVASVLEGSGLAYPIQGAGDGSGTVGGHLAGRTSNALHLRYGPARDWLLGAEWITGGGQPSRVGAPVVKNVAGYDLAKLLVGSHGSLGVLLRVILRLRPAPPAEARAVVTGGDAAALAPMAHRLAARPGGPVGIEVLERLGEGPGPAHERAWREVAHALNAFGLPGGSGPLMLLYYQGFEGELAAERENLERLGWEHGLQVSWEERPGASQPTGAWRLLRAAGPASGLCLARLGVPARRAGELWQAVREAWGSRSEPGGSGFGLLLVEPASGVVRALGAPPHEGGWRRVRETAEGLGGYAVWEAAPLGRYESSAVPWEAWDEAVRRVFDPAGLLWAPRA